VGIKLVVVGMDIEFLVDISDKFFEEDKSDSFFEKDRSGMELMVEV
jgi:hypothetical protein